MPIGGDTLAEGIAVFEPGTMTSQMLAGLLDDVVLVSEPQLENALSLLLQIEKTVVEGAGAAGLAAVLANREMFAGKKVGIVLSGGNIDTRLLANVLLRELARSGRLARLRIQMQDRPGSLFKVAKVFDEHNVNIIEVGHQRIFTNLPAKGLITEIECETRDAQQLEALIRALEREGYPVEPGASSIEPRTAEAVHMPFVQNNPSVNHETWLKPFQRGEGTGITLAREANRTLRAARRKRPVVTAPVRFPRFFVTSPAPCPYLPGRSERKVFTELKGAHAEALNDALSRIGFRRSQNVAYRPPASIAMPAFRCAWSPTSSSRLDPEAQPQTQQRSCRDASQAVGDAPNNSSCCAAISACAIPAAA